MNNEIIGYERIDKFNPEKLEKLQEHYAAILELLGEDITREGLEKTPLRVAKSMQFLTQGYTMDPKEILLSAKFKEDYRQMVVVKDIELFSLCEHHMIPFIGKAHVAYIPNGYITGLSKIARVVEAYSRRLQVQERLTTQIKEAINDALHPLGRNPLCPHVTVCISLMDSVCLCFWCFTVSLFFFIHFFFCKQLLSSYLCKTMYLGPRRCLGKTQKEGSA